MGEITIRNGFRLAPLKTTPGKKIPCERKSIEIRGKTKGSQRKEALPEDLVWATNDSLLFEGVYAAIAKGKGKVAARRRWRA